MRLISKSIAATLAAGEYRLYSNVRMSNPVFTNSTIQTDSHKPLALYPNPANNVVYYAFPSNPNAAMELHVYSATGKCVYTEKGQLKGVLEVGSWAPGMYHIQVLGDQYTYSGKLWVNP
jgi:hypothetical protein